MFLLYAAESSATSGHAAHSHRAGDFGPRLAREDLADHIACLGSQRPRTVPVALQHRDGLIVAVVHREGVLLPLASDDLSAGRVGDRDDRGPITRRRTRELDAFGTDQLDVDVVARTHSDDIPELPEGLGELASSVIPNGMSQQRAGLGLDVPLMTLCRQARAEHRRRASAGREVVAV